MKLLELTKKLITFAVATMLLFWMQSAIASGALSSMRIGQTAEKTRVVFDLKQAQTYKVTELSNPSRLVVDFYNTANFLSFKNKHITDNRLFKIRVSDNPKRVRVVLDLHKTPEYKAFLLDEKSSKARLVIDLTDKPLIIPAQSKAIQSKPLSSKSNIQAKPVEKVATKPVLDNSKKLETKQADLTAHTAVKSAIENDKVSKETSPASQPLIHLTKTSYPENSLKASKPLVNKHTQSLLNKESAVFTKSHEFVIAIDAGHGGKDTGAIGHNGIYEKDATLSMAKELKKVIDGMPGMHAVLTRDRDVFIPLSKRVQIAKQKNADLFISVHADAFHDQSVRGGSVYILSERGASSTMAKLLATSENASLQDVSLNGMDDDVAFALSDLSREANVKSSRRLATTVLKEMQKTVKMHKHSVQSAGFAVLKSIDMPSLLIETAFISNPHEARRLMSKSFQVKMANAIGNGLNKYVQENTKKPSWGETLYVHYKVQRGDTLSQIAANYDVSTQALKQLNGIKNANALYVGKKLKIPVSQNVLAGL